MIKNKNICKNCKKKIKKKGWNSTYLCYKCYNSIPLTYYILLFFIIFIPMVNAEDISVSKSFIVNLNINTANNTVILTSQDGVYSYNFTDTVSDFNVSFTVTKSEFESMTNTTIVNITYFYNSSVDYFREVMDSLLSSKLDYQSGEDRAFWQNTVLNTCLNKTIELQEINRERESAVDSCYLSLNNTIKDNSIFEEKIQLKQDMIDIRDQQLKMDFVLILIVLFGFMYLMLWIFKGNPNPVSWFKRGVTERK